MTTANGFARLDLGGASGDPEGRAELVMEFRALAEALNGLGFRAEWLTSFVGASGHDEGGDRLVAGLVARLDEAREAAVKVALGIRRGRFGVESPSGGRESPLGPGADPGDGEELAEAREQLELARFARDGAESELTCVKQDLAEERRRAEALKLELHEARDRLNAAAMEAKARELASAPAVPIREPLLNGKHDGPVVAGDAADIFIVAGPIEGGAVELPDDEAPDVGPVPRSDYLVKCNPCGSIKRKSTPGGCPKGHVGGFSYVGPIVEEAPPPADWRTTPIHALVSLGMPERLVEACEDCEIVEAGTAWDDLERGWLRDSADWEPDELAGLRDALVKLRAEAGDPAPALGKVEAPLAFDVGVAERSEFLWVARIEAASAAEAEAKAKAILDLPSFGRSFLPRPADLANDASVARAGGWVGWYDFKGDKVRAVVAEDWRKRIGAPKGDPKVHDSIRHLRAGAGDPAPADVQSTVEAWDLVEGRRFRAAGYDAVYEVKSISPVDSIYCGKCIKHHPMADGGEVINLIARVVGEPDVLFHADGLRKVAGRYVEMPSACGAGGVFGRAVELFPEPDPAEAPSGPATSHPDVGRVITGAPLDTDGLLRLALAKREGMAERWEAMVRDGATDEEVKAAIGRAFDLGLRPEGKPGGAIVEAGGSCSVAGGANPKFWAHKPDWSGRPTLESTRLVDRVRKLLEIPGEDGRPVEARPSRRKGAAS